MANTTKGVRQVNENVLQEDRALIYTSEDFTNYDWATIPDGSLHIDINTGNIMVKLKGESTWSPTGLKQDGTLVISRDTQFCDEIFVVTSLDNGDGTFTYRNANNEQRYKPFDKDGYVFEIENGSYLQGRNYLEVTIDDCLTRTVMNNGIEEITEKKFKILEQLVVGQKIAVRYIKWNKVGNPYPRFYLNEDEPESPEYGDFWLDPNGSLDEGSLGEEVADDPKNVVDWNQITGTPTTLAGYGVRETYSLSGHTHRTLDIADFPTKLPANGGDANTVQGREPGSAPGNLATIENNGFINPSIIPETFMTDKKLLFIQDTRPTNPKNNAIWFCTEKVNDTPHIEVYSRYQWVKVASL